MGVASYNWLARATLNSLHARTLVLTDVQTPFLGTPLVPLVINGRRLVQTGREGLVRLRYLRGAAPSVFFIAVAH